MTVCQLHSKRYESEIVLYLSVGGETCVCVCDESDYCNDQLHVPSVCLKLHLHFS